MTVRFDEAWRKALALADDVSTGGIDVVVVRDLLGRVSFIVGDGAKSAVIADTWSEQLRSSCGPFTAPTPVLDASELVQPDAILQAADLLIRRERDPDHGRLAILERGVVGAEWTRLQESPQRSRVTLYGFKGGVGRSTAAFMLAQHLASSGRCVLVIDLDLESPGVSTLLQDEGDLPDFGLVDHFVEAGVGNAVDLDLVSRSTTIHGGGNGEVWLAPAGGRARDGYDYLAKLNRVYTDLPSSGDDRAPRTFASRLADAVAACETAVSDRSRLPDVVLLDSRAGIHDIAAAAITQLSELSFLFGADTGATWSGYRALFRQWSLDVGRARIIRDRLRMVASPVLSEVKEEYLRSYRDHAQACFAETLYDDVVAGADESEPEAFNPSPEDVDAPHSPLPILFVPELVGLDPARRREWSRSPLVVSAYGEFLEGASRLILGD